MSRADDKRARLRAGMASGRAVVAIGAHDALTAKLIGSYGFDAVWVSGLAVATMVHAIPDVNLTTMSETLDAAIRIDRATDLPVVADCDNGFGGLNNVVRTLVEFEAAGISAISI
jgi:phosphoenolpyruvate phosphomutase